MRIVIFSQLYFPENATINETARLLASRGHDVTVMTGLPNAPAGKIFDGYGYLEKLREKIDGVDVLRNWLVPRGRGTALRMALNYLSYVFSASLGLIRLIGKKPDIIFVNQLSPVTVALPAIVYKKLCRVPMAMWIHDLWPDSVVAAGAMSDGPAYRLIGAMVRFIYRNCDLIFAQSLAMFETLAERGYPREKLRHLPNPIDPFFVPLSEAPIPAALSSVPPGFKLMFAGGIGKAQDVPTILAAAKILHEKQSKVQFIIVGDGRDRRDAQQMAQDLGIGDMVHFAGSHQAAHMPQFYAHADAMLVTLLDRPIFSVTVPLKVQTYLACAKPIVCNVRGEAARIVNEAKAGATVAPENPRLLADAIEQLTCLDRFALAELGSNALRYYKEHYASEKLLATIENGLSELTQATPSKRVP